MFEIINNDTINWLQMQSLVDESDMKRTKRKILNALHSPKFCCICLKNEDLQQLDARLLHESWQDAAPTVREALHDIFRDEIQGIVSSDFMCNSCMESTVYSYMFIRNSKQNAKIFTYYLTQLEMKTEDVVNCLVDNENMFKAIITLENLLTNIQSDTEIFIKKENPIKDEISPRIIKTCEQSKLLKKVKCPQCSEKSCEHEKYIKSYQKQKVLNKGEVKCNDCEYYCWSLPKLISHVNKEHLNSSCNICEICGKIFYSRYEYNKHINYDHKQKVFCPFCDRMFFSENVLRKHKEICETIERPYKCEDCQASFDTANRAGIHRRKHTGFYSCHECSQNFANKSQFKGHKCEPSSGGKKVYYNCSVCQTKFNTIRKLLTHLSTHSSNEKHSCKVCDVQFNTRQEYLYHTRQSEHRNRMYPHKKYRYKCKFCDYRACSSVIFEAHVNRYHLKISPYTCYICDKRFTSENKLKQHIESHTGLKKPKICDICGDKLGGPTALKKHMRRHTGEKPYPCDQCELAFVSSSERHMHKQRVHQAEKSVACPLCGVAFYTNTNMRSHVRKVHWKRREKFDHTKLEGLAEEHYHLFRDKRMLVLE